MYKNFGYEIRNRGKRKREKKKMVGRSIDALLLMQDTLLADALFRIDDGRATFLVLGVANRAILVMVADLRLAEPVQLARAKGVEVDGEGEGDEEADEGDDHGDVVVLVVGHEPRDGREQGPARHRGHDPGRAALGVPAQAADRQREDGGENARLEEEDDGERGHPALAPRPHRGGDEDHDHRHEEHENPPRLDVHHATGRKEPSDGEQSLSDGVAIRSGRVADSRALDRVLDELRCNTDLSPDVAELRGDAEEELVLLAHRPVHVAGKARALLRLESHVGIRDFRDRREVEDDSEEKNEGGDAEVGPLHIGQIFGVGVLEEDARRQQRGHDRADGLKRLRKLQTELGQPGRTARGDERVCRSLQRRETGADDEERTAEAGKRALDGRGPEHQRTDPINAQTSDERPPITELPDNPTRVSGRANEVRAKISALQTTGFGGRDVEGVLKLGIENIQETICETPQKEEHRHQCYRDNGLLHSQSGGARETGVGDTLAVLLVYCVDIGRPTLCHDVRNLGFFLLAKHDVSGYRRGTKRRDTIERTDVLDS